MSHSRLELTLYSCSQLLIHSLLIKTKPKHVIIDFDQVVCLKKTKGLQHD